jgi:hypothetical protein
VTAKRRMPPLKMDEVLLLVDTYFSLQNVENREIIEETTAELSKEMRSLPFYKNLNGNPSFRSVAGMRMCLFNVASADANINCAFSHGSITQRKVLDYYTDRKSDLHAYAQAIKEIATIDFPIRDEFDDFIGGALLPSFHCHLEKTDKTIKAVLKEATDQHQTICRLCGMDLSITYGSSVSELMEIHINLPLSHNTQRLNISPSDLILLCPTCHKFAHTKPVLYEIDRAQSAIKAGL